MYSGSGKHGAGKVVVVENGSGKDKSRGCLLLAGIAGSGLADP